MNPSFSSPANSNQYRENYDKVFGKCKTPDCNEQRTSNSDRCYACLEKLGLLSEAPETD